MPSFDPSIIHNVAKNLYKQASSVTRAYSLFGALLGGAIAFAGLSGVPQPVQPSAYILPAFIFAMFGIIGFYIGKNRAFALKLKAQKILLDLQIEKNTRKEGVE